MPLNYVCDSCGKQILNSMDAVSIRAESHFVLCEDCWEKAKEKLELKNETITVK